MNVEFITKSETVLKVVIPTFFVLGIILDICIWKWRKLVNFLLHIELINIILRTCVPYNNGEAKNETFLYQLILLFVFYSC